MTQDTPEQFAKFVAAVEGGSTVFAHPDMVQALEGFIEVSDTSNARKAGIVMTQDTKQADDGLYRYRWTTPFGRHAVYFRVLDGLIEKNDSTQSNPIKAFEGGRLGAFIDSRALTGWRFDDDALHQIPERSPDANP